MSEWTQEDVCIWLKTLSLSCDYTHQVKEGAIDGAVIESVIDGVSTWKEILGAPVGDVTKIKKSLLHQRLGASLKS